MRDPRANARGPAARVRLGAVTAASLLLCALAAEGAAAQVQYGADLNRAANAQFDCTQTPSLIGLLPSGVDNCTYVGTSATGEGTATPFPGGVVTRVRVKTSAPTGPMRVTVARALSSLGAGFGCCFYGGQSQPFTPQANATTAVDVRLPVRNDLDPAFGQTVDYLGITVLGPGTRIPANGPQSLGGSIAFFPQITPADADSGRVDGYSNQALPLLNVDFFPLCGAATAAQRATARRLNRRHGERGDPEAPATEVPTAKASGGACLGGVTIDKGKRSGKRAVLTMLCNLSATCTGRVVLNSKARGRRATASKKVGKSKFKIASGAEKKVRVKLRKSARKRKKLKVKVKAKVDGGPNESGKLKLKR